MAVCRSLDEAWRNPGLAAPFPGFRQRLHPGLLADASLWRKRLLENAGYQLKVGHDQGLPVRPELVEG